MKTFGIQYQPAQHVPLYKGTNTNMWAASASAGDLWINTTYHNTLFKYNGFIWWPVSVDPDVGWMEHEDFIQYQPQGSTDWLATASGGSGNLLDGTTTNPGIVQLQQTTGYSTFIHSSKNIIPGASLILLEICLNVEVLSTALQEFIIYAGLGDSTSAEPADGVYFVYDRATYGDVWRGRSSKASTRTTGSTNSAALAADTFTKLTCRIQDGTAYFYLDGVQFDSVATNIPDTNSNMTGRYVINIRNAAGTTARNVELDYFRTAQLMNARR